MKKSETFTDIEKQAIRARAKEAKAEEKANRDRAVGEAELQKAIAAMPDTDKRIAKRIHELVTKTAPELWPKTWYGMPAYAKDGKVVCFFQSGHKFKTRYSTFGFQDAANLDDGAMWPTAFALKKLAPADEKRIVELVKKAIT